MAETSLKQVEVWSRPLRAASMVAVLLIHHLCTWLVSLGHKINATHPGIMSPLPEGRRVKSRWLSIWMVLSLLKKRRSFY